MVGGKTRPFLLAPTVVGNPFRNMALVVDQFHDWLLACIFGAKLIQSYVTNTSRSEQNGPCDAEDILNAFSSLKIAI